MTVNNRDAVTGAAALMRWADDVLTSGKVWRFPIESVTPVEVKV